jgi:hypothetical protein
MRALFLSIDNYSAAKLIPIDMSSTYFLLFFFIIKTSINGERSEERNLQSPKGLTYRLAIRIDEGDTGFSSLKQTMTQHMTQLMTKVNEITSSELNIHLQVTYLQETVLENLNMDTHTRIRNAADSMARESSKVEEFDHFILFHSRPAYRYQMSYNKPCNRKSVSRINLHEKILDAPVFPYDDDFLVRLTAKAVIQNILHVSHYASSESCVCEDIKFTHSQCLSDDNKGSFYTMTSSRQVSDCYKQTLISKIHEKQFACLKTSEANESQSIIPICGNGLTEGSEECDCYFRDNDCRTMCNKSICSLKFIPEKPVKSMDRKTSQFSSGLFSLSSSTTESATSNYQTEKTLPTKSPNEEETNENVAHVRESGSSDWWFLFAVALAMTAFAGGITILILLELRKHRNIFRDKDQRSVILFSENKMKGTSHKKKEDRLRVSEKKKKEKPANKIAIETDLRSIMMEKDSSVLDTASDIDRF